MSQQTETPRLSGPPAQGRPKMLNHLAYVTHDVEGTVDFYTRVMGMPMVSTVIGSKVPSTGDDFPYFHVFFRLDDGSTLAFFEAPGLPRANPKGHPAYDIFDHLAFEADTPDDIYAWAAWLCQNDVEIVGPTDHGIILSIYFRDPVNDIRLEITCPLVEDWNDRQDAAARDLQDWTDVKNMAHEQGQDVSEALLKFIAARDAEHYSRGDEATVDPDRSA
ncbi:VOC family protein [Pseudonocardia sp. NPDC049635]|uniref:VOC family protein n=1 Tax=Pseudonocardia sp. NPDC049635 TaxID=3155506 RepID=UPI0033CF4AD8